MTSSYEQVEVVDALVGMFFWWDGAPPTKRAIYKGVIVAGLGNGYYLLRFGKTPILPTGVHEVVHVATIVEQAWSLFENADGIAAAFESWEKTRGAA